MLPFGRLWYGDLLRKFKSLKSRAITHLVEMNAPSLGKPYVGLVLLFQFGLASAIRTVKPPEFPRYIFSRVTRSRESCLQCRWQPDRDTRTQERFLRNELSNSEQFCP